MQLKMIYKIFCYIIWATIYRVIIIILTPQVTRMGCLFYPYAAKERFFLFIARLSMSLSSIKLHRDSGFEIFMQGTGLSNLPTVKFSAHFMQHINH